MIHRQQLCEGKHVTDPLLTSVKLSELSTQQATQQRKQIKVMKMMKAHWAAGWGAGLVRVVRESVSVVGVVRKVEGFDADSTCTIGSHL